jgi:hypothetical protein
MFFVMLLKEKWFLSLAVLAFVLALLSLFAFSPFSFARFSFFLWRSHGFPVFSPRTNQNLLWANSHLFPGAPKEYFSLQLL